MNSNIWSNFIFELKSKNDIVDVISSYLQVVQKGKGYWALCPFHNDRNPSMSINRDGQFYHCFVCDAGGDVIKFVQDYENCSFYEAVEILAQRVNMEVPQFNQNQERDIDEKKRLKDACFDVCLFSAKHYFANLWKKGGEYALDYLKNRGITPKTAKHFGLGLSKNWDDLCDALISNKKNMEVALKAGIVSRRDDGTYFDNMGQRLIVPIIDVSGKVVAFGGRTFSKDKNIAKYKNTSITPIFDKGKVLYGLNFAKKAKMQYGLNHIIIVEGYMDVIAMHQVGFTQTVASMGTSLTLEQAKQIKRFVKTVYICYDGDVAGQNATIRGMDILQGEGLDVKIVTIPNGQDPDEFVRDSGVGAFRKLLNGAMPLIDYKLFLARRKNMPENESVTALNEFRRKYANEAIAILASQSEVDRETYLPALSDDTKLSVAFLREQIRKGKEIEETIETTQVARLQDREIVAIAYVLACKLNTFDFADDDFEIETDNTTFNKVIDFLKVAKSDKRLLKMGDVYSMPELTEADADMLNIIMKTSFSSTEVDKKSYLDCVNFLKKEQYRRKIEKLNILHKVTQDSEERRRISKEISILMKKMNAKL